MMDKYQALDNFMSGFGIPAFEETTVPDNQPFPYLTYESATASFDSPVMGTFSLWYRDTSWKSIVEKSEEISEAISRGGKIIPYDDSALWIKKGSPWAQRMSDSSDELVRRIYHNIVIEFFD